MNIKIYAYLRASTKKQNALRSKDDLIEFAKNKKVSIDKFYVENRSGAILEREQLNNLIENCDPNNKNIILIEKLDRLTRLDLNDWKKLNLKLRQKNIDIVTIDQSQTHSELYNKDHNFLGSVIIGIIINLNAEKARDDYLTRRNRIAQGIKAKIHNFKGKQANHDKHELIKTLLNENTKTYKEISNILNCSLSLINTVKKNMLANNEYKPLNTNINKFKGKQANHDKHELIKTLLNENKLIIKDIAIKLNCSISTVERIKRNLLKAGKLSHLNNNIKEKRQKGINESIKNGNFKGKQANHDKHELIKSLLLENKLLIKDIAIKLNCSISLIYKVKKTMLSNNEPLPVPKIKGKQANHDKHELIKSYLVAINSKTNKKYKLSDIANICDCSLSLVKTIKAKFKNSIEFKKSALYTEKQDNLL